MPTYEYECRECGHHFEKFQNMTDEPLKRCVTMTGISTPNVVTSAMKSSREPSSSSSDAEVTNVRPGATAHDVAVPLSVNACFA